MIFFLLNDLKRLADFEMENGRSFISLFPQFNREQ